MKTLYIKIRVDWFSLANNTSKRPVNTLKYFILDILCPGDVRCKKKKSMYKWFWRRIGKLIRVIFSYKIIFIYESIKG